MEQIRNKRVTLKHGTAQQSGQKMSKVLSGKVIKSESLTTKNGPRWIVKTESNQEAWGSINDPILTAVRVGQNVMLIDGKNGWQPLGNEAAAVAPAIIAAAPTAAAPQKITQKGDEIAEAAFKMRSIFNALNTAFTGSGLRPEELVLMALKIYEKN